MYAKFVLKGWRATFFVAKKYLVISIDKFFKRRPRSFRRVTGFTRLESSDYLYDV